MAASAEIADAAPACARERRRWSRIGDHDSRRHPSTLLPPRVSRGRVALSHLPALLLPGVCHRTRGSRHLRGVPQKTRGERNGARRRSPPRAAGLAARGWAGDRVAVFLRSRTDAVADSSGGSRRHGVGGVQVKRREKGAIELYEEAVYLLRCAPASALAAYYAGSLPFVLGFLFFWADLSQSATAYEHCAPASLGMALLFCWMMFCQSVFVRQLRGELSGAPPGRWFSGTARRL